MDLLWKSVNQNHEKMMKMGNKRSEMWVNCKNIVIIEMEMKMIENIKVKTLWFFGCYYDEMDTQKIGFFFLWKNILC